MKSVLINDFIKTTAAAVFGGCVTLGAYTYFNEDKQVIIEKVPASYTRVASNPGSANADIMQPDFSVAAEKVTPAVVHIRSTTKANRVEEVRTIPLPFRDFFGDDLFGRGFGPFGMTPQPMQAVCHDILKDAKCQFCKAIMRHTVRITEKISTYTCH